MRRRPLYTPEEARAEAEREGEREKWQDSAAAEGCGCCLVEGLIAITSCAALLALPTMLLR